jgi:hypothetical protein
MRTVALRLLLLANFALVAGASLRCGGMAQPGGVAAGGGDAAGDSAAPLPDAQGTPDEGAADEDDGAPVPDGAGDDDAADYDATIDATDSGPRGPHPPALHRPAASACSAPRPPGDPECVAVVQPILEAGCASDNQCTGGIDGRCGCDPIGAVGTVIECSYDLCLSDSDCDGGVCSCRENPIHPSGGGFIWQTSTWCMGGNCRIDSDCGPGGYCSPSFGNGSDCVDWFYFCHTPDDECTDDSDCPHPPGVFPPYCAYDANVGHWACSSTICTDG